MEQTLYDYLRGNWSVKRRIEDLLAKQDNWFTGEAQFVGTGVGLNYTEAGRLSVGDALIEAKQTYQWHCQANGATVYFDPYREFHSFVIKGQSASAHHLCGDDQYDGRYHFPAADAWQLTWTVKGPRKNYISTTNYQRKL